MSRIDDVMFKFSRIRGASIGRGPDHPTDPDARPKSRIAHFLEAYPRLADDLGYVEFLQKFAGASIQNDDVSQIIDILGFGDASTDMEEVDGPIVDKDGFLMIAEAVYHIREDGRNVDTLQHAFAFDVTGTRPSGVYHSLSSSRLPDEDFHHAFESFAAWLEHLVDHGGWLDPPGAG
jgi:hypothetical protein